MWVRKSHSCCQEAAPAWALLRLQLPSGHLHLLSHAVLHVLQCGYLFQHGPPWAAGRQPTSPWSCPEAAGKFLLWCLEHLLPSFSGLGVCRAAAGLLLTHFSPLSHSCCTALFTLSETHYHRGMTSTTYGLSFGQQQVCFRPG